VAAGHAAQDLEEALVGGRVERQLRKLPHLLANPHTIPNAKEFTCQNPVQGSVTQEQWKCHSFDPSSELFGWIA
jgi:hypothetical protein